MLPIIYTGDASHERYGATDTSKLLEERAVPGLI